jgi:glycosyltransferase involved in cell wall biosynthesis
MKIGFLIWGREGAYKETDAYLQRILVLKKAAEGMGYETQVVFANQFDGPLKLAFLSKKNVLSQFLGSCNAVYLGHTDCAAYAACAKPGGKGLIYDCHTPQIGERLMAMKQRPTPANVFLYLRALLHERLAARRCSVITTVSNPSIDYYARVFGRKRDDLFLVRNPVEPELFPVTPLPQSERLRFVYIGGMDKWAGIPQFIEAYRKSSKQFDLTMVGFDDAHIPLMEYARGLGIDAHPKMPRPEALKHLARSHIGVIPSPREWAECKPGAFPTKWAEYLAMGRAVLTTPGYEAAPLTSENRFGIVCEYGIGGMARGMDEAARLPLADIEDMGSRGREWVLSHCSTEAVGKAFDRAIARATNQVR